MMKSRLALLGLCLLVWIPSLSESEEPDCRKSPIHEAWVEQRERCDGSKIEDYRKLEADHREISSRVSSIGMLRSGGCGEGCASFSVVFQADGTVSYFGYEHVTHLGKREGRINSHRFEQMAKFVVELGFPDLHRTYSSTVTDHQATYFLVVIDKKKEVVMNYAEAGPAGLWALEKVIDNLLSQVEWSQ